MTTGISSFEFGGRYCWCCVCFLWIWTTMTVSGTLMIQQILVPVQVMSGSNVVLRCLFAEIGSNSTPISGNHKHGITEYDPAAAGPLYSLKWYKGSHEFYRHLPRENPPTKVFHWSQFNIETDAMEPGKVILRGVNSEAEGSYKCEVSAEGTFHTDFAEANLTVIDVENESLNLVQDSPLEEARTGDRRKWNCTFGQSRPPAHIAWFINGEPVASSSPYSTANSRSAVEEQSGEAEMNSRTGATKPLEFVNSVLELTLSERHFKNQWLRVSCVVQIGSGFKKTKEIHIRQQKQGSADRPTNHNPSAVVGPNGSRTGTNRENEFQPSTMSKIAGSPKATIADSGTSSLVNMTGQSSFSWMLLMLIFIQTMHAKCF
ncbi:uncharacterized protein LOC124204205 [Daphnia pulex]|uniref:uncharacterized protein LOC124204205 n=1 Tax=Daphnia pulex TaxID=6669 RepID=UPI001EDFA32B|nr:uncharacterized protein LOC124204205 [Daphnia pulex]